MPQFILEIGSEELPSRFLQREEDELRERFTAALNEAGLPYGDVMTRSTPRRASVTITDLGAVQPMREEVISGPPVRVAYDADGKPTKALEGFARTNGVDLAEVFTQETDKGSYVAVKKAQGGKAALELLADICPAIIQTLPFAKRMRWGKGTFAYARPLRWLCALLDDQIVPFSVEGLSSGREIFGHRIHGKGPFTVTSAADYQGCVAEQCGVTLDAKARRDLIVREGDVLAAKLGGTVLWNDALLDEVQGLVEHPVPLIGDFDASFLEVPREVLLTSMETHQKSFGIVDAKGTLLPHFLTVANLTPVDMAIVKNGWERVLRARLEDARFFWQTDLRASFDHWLEKLEHVIFIGPLGSMGNKTRRLEALCRWLAEQCAHTGNSDTAGIKADQAARAGRLSKADLVSGMVGEFDTLQGIMGGIYAARMGEDDVVAQALKEQYLPAGPDSLVPASVAGALLSMADKADTLVGCFGLNKIPTGAADPNGLRRCALGIIRILAQFGMQLDVRSFFAKAQELYGDQQWKLEPQQALDKLQEFFAGRLRQYLLSQGHDVLHVDATLGAGAANLPMTLARLQALKDFSKSGEAFTRAVQTFKRVSNIGKQAQGEDVPAHWDAALLAEKAEQELGVLLDKLLPELDTALAAGGYAFVLQKLNEIRPTVDAFFDGVMVMDKDMAVRRNRLAMLKALADRFAMLADFSCLQI